MEKDVLEDEIFCLISGILPYGDVKRINETITDGRNYSEILKQIEKEYTTSDKIKKEIELRNDIKNAICELEDIEDIKEKLQVIFNGKKTIPLNYQKLLIAASIVILIVAGILTSFIKPRIDPDKVYNSNYEQYLPNGIIRKNSDLFEIAKEKYTQRSIEEAKILLDNIKGVREDEPERLLYKGLTCMELKDFNGAINNFETLINNCPACKWTNHAMWYLGLSYLKMRELGKAKDIFEIITKNKYYNYEKAENILEKMRAPFSFVIK